MMSAIWRAFGENEGNQTESTNQTKWKKKKKKEEAKNKYLNCVLVYTNPPPTTWIPPQTIAEWQ